MKNGLLMLLCAQALHTSVFATSYAPHPKPKVSCEEAISLASKFAAKDNPSIAKYYIDRVWCGILPNETKRTWVISWANENEGWYFVVVDMDRSTRLPPKGHVYERHPFEIKPPPLPKSKPAESTRPDK